MEEDEEVLDSINQYFHPIKLIKRGAFGRVYQCIELNTVEGEHFAVKIIDKRSVKRHKIQSLRNEAKVLQTVKHPNIIKFLGFVECDHFMFIKMEYARGGTLGQFIKKKLQKKEIIKHEQISVIIKNVFQGLSYLHSLNIIHRDLKPQNILFEKQESFETIKIADFGMSVKLQHKNGKVSTHCGTLLYMAPEIIFRKQYSRNIDVWSCAIIMYMLFSKGSHPLIPNHNRKNITVEDYSLLITKEWPELQNQQANDLLRKLAAFQSFQRYAAADALKHPFLGGDYAPLTYHESFKGFQFYQQSKQIIRTIFICSQYMKKSTRITVPKQYLDKVQKFNQQTIDRKIKQSVIKRQNAFGKVTSDDDVRYMARQFSKKNSSEADSPTLPLKKTKFTEFLNLNLMESTPLVQTVSLKPIAVQKAQFHIGKPKRTNSFTSSNIPVLKPISSISPKKGSKTALKVQSPSPLFLFKYNEGSQKKSERDTYTSANKRRISLSNKCNRETVATSFFKK